MKENLSPPKESDFSNKQLTLFQFFLNPDTRKNEKSNLIYFWDSIPKYFVTKKEQLKIRKDGFLPTITRNFRHRNIDYIVKIRPALITVEGKDVAFYPSAKEGLIEDALRKLATKTGSGYLDSKRHGVVFTIYELRQELKQFGHTYSHSEIIESLEILQNTIIEVYSDDKVNGSIMFRTSPITSSIAVSKKDYIDDPKAKWHVEFSIIVSKGINELDYRQYNYQIMMTLRSQLARYLMKRLSMNYIQASMIYPYTINLDTIVRDSGLLNNKEYRENRRQLEASLKELVDKKVLMIVESEALRGCRGKIENIKYTLTPSLEFVAEMKAANKRDQLVSQGKIE